MSRRMGRSFNQRMAEERRVEAQMQDLADILKSHANIKSEVASEHRVEQMRRDRLRRLRQAEEKQGAILEQKLRQEYEAKILDEQQNRLVAELQHRKSQQASEDARIRRLCEQSEVLRALSEKLQAAQMNKERHAQIQHNLQIKKERLEKEIELEAKLVQEREQAERWEKQRVQVRHNNMGNLKEDLDKQILDLQRKKKAAYEEFLKEKEQVDEVVKKVLQKEKQAEGEKCKKRAELREMIHQYEIDRRNLKHRLKEEEAAEIKKIQEWAELQERRLNEIAEKKSLQQQHEAAKYDRVAAGMERQRKEQEEMEQLLIEMFIAEADAKIEEEARTREARRLAQRQEMIEGHKRQQVLAEQKRTDQKLQEQVLRAQMMTKFAEDDRIDQMNAERARRAKIEHHRSVQKMLEERRALFEMEREEEMCERERELREEEERLQIVERERERMLREHARKLREFLPRGVIRNEKDKHLVFDNVVQEQGENQPGELKRL